MSERRGDCYQSAFDELMAGASSEILAAAIGEEPLLVHGYPRLTKGPDAGHQFGHAWVEVGPFVLDHGVPLIGEIFYEVGRIEPAECSTFNAQEALERALATENYGPWGPVPAEAAALWERKGIQVKT